MDLIKARIRESIETKSRILEDDEILTQVSEAANMIRDSLKKGGKVLFCGNGGSASDSLHLTGEIVGRFQKERLGLAAVSLNADVATMTAIANDYGYDSVFSRAVEGLMKPEDVLVGISTSGNSENVYQAIMKSKEMRGKSVSLLGKNGGKIKDVSDIAIIVPSDCTARIQESHIMIGHIICELVEEDY